MKKHIILAFFIVFASCKNNEKDLEKAILVGDALFVSKLVDSIKIYRKEKVLKEDYILVFQNDKKIGKDSLIKAKFRLDFYKNNKKIGFDKVELTNYQPESGWSATYGLSIENAEKAPFLKIRNGYEACGYAQDNFLYSIEKNKVQQVHYWRTMSDSGWGVHLEFIQKTPTVIYSNTISFSPTENETIGNEDIGTVEYSDSIKFERKNNKWIKTYITPKDSVYRKFDQSFNDFHGIKKK